MPAGLSVERTAGGLAVSVRASVPPAPLVLRIHSDRNATVPRFSDVSPLQPAGARKPPPTERECWYPVIDVAIEPRMAALVELAGGAAGTRVSWNGWLRREHQPAAATLRYPADVLLEWENTLWVDSAAPRVTGFHLLLPVSVPARGGRIATLRPLSEGWSGRLELVGT